MKSESVTSLQMQTATVSVWGMVMYSVVVGRRVARFVEEYKVMQHGIYTAQVFALGHHDMKAPADHGGIV